MTTLSAEIIADSVSKKGARITSFQLCYPRWIHAEMMTHRALARNASSSRAIPIRKMNRGVMRDPALPLHLGRNEPGMQAYQQIEGERERRIINSLWMKALRVSVESAEEMTELCGVAKQVANRLTEPHQHISVVVTATEWQNFFALRCHPAAEPHIRGLAWMIADKFYSSAPHVLSEGQWHLPYVREEEYDEHSMGDLKKFSAARCARVSYRNHDGASPTSEQDLKLYDRLLAGLQGDDELEPGHLSPFEHQATPLANPDEFSGPFRGWKQHRKEFDRENMAFDYEAAKKRGWRDDALKSLGIQFSE